jgi:pilus assembly protein Flp/PilA
VGVKCFERNILFTDFEGRGRLLGKTAKTRVSPQIGRILLMRSLINRFRNDDEGAALVEYGMLVGLIAVICLVAVTTLGTEISTAFSIVANALSGV